MTSVMTSSNHATGTDRVAEVALSMPADWYINVQGDEPFLDPNALERMMQACDDADESVSVINAYAPIADEQEFRDPTVPKVISGPDGRLFYMSRAEIPTTKELTFVSANRQIGLYGFRPAALAKFAATKGKTPLEQLEDIEILRFLELGLQVSMIEVPSGGLAIDVPADLEAARELL
jgi:3-deoxy-manno-octulosonate cytidylyltransferase (CMP-KDO synthetase)